MTSLIGNISPLLSVMEIPSSSILSFIAFVGLARLVNIVLNAVPAFSPFIPALDIKPIAIDVSSIV
ncbi:Uncharacterised protein [Streptococcus pneumoniae]|nr:Uncharacterised protein [Streptococcus pneumoniae]